MIYVFDASFVGAPALCTLDDKLTAAAKKRGVTVMI
jgi:hypothetical protein